MKHILANLLLVVVTCTFGCGKSDRTGADTQTAKPQPASKTESQWQSLFEGASLGHWKPTDFAGAGEVYIEDGAIVMMMGDPMTGVTWSAEPPMKINYEIELEARRVLGNDFFCGLTFPVGDDPCSLILGGWGGATVGLSSLSGFDAANNQTTSFIGFTRDRWYRIRLRVLEDRITAWLDDEKIIDADITEHWIGIRPEVEKSRPLGIASYITESHLKNIRWREVPRHFR